MPIGGNDINHRPVVRLLEYNFLGAGISSLAAIALFVFRDPIQERLDWFLSVLDWNRIGNPLRLLSAETAKDPGSPPTMIPSATTLTLKCGLLCTAGEDVGVHGHFPLLGSTENLLEKLGFKFCDDLNNNDNGSRQHCGLLAELIQPSEDATSTDGERLDNVLLVALDDIRDLRHRVKEEEDAKGGNLSRKAKRDKFKVNSLEKQRAKLHEKQQKNENQDSEKSGNGEARNDNDINTATEIHDAWIRMARVFNSVRLLLFLFSEEEGLDMLANYDDLDGEDRGIKNYGKMISKLSDALDVLALSLASVEGNSGKDGIDDSSKPLTKTEKSKWEQFISRGVQTRQRLSMMRTSSDASSDGSENDIGVANQTIIDLTDDSIASSNLVDPVDESAVDLTGDSSASGNLVVDGENDENSLDDLSEDMMANAVDTENPPVEVPNEHRIPAPEDAQTQPQEIQPENTANENLNDAKKAVNQQSKKLHKFVPARCVLWNTHLDELMKDLVSALSTNSGDEDTIQRLDHAFAGDGNSSAAVVRKRAKIIDEKFSLIVGITGSEDYRKRKDYLLSIERLRYRVEQTIRRGGRNNEFDDARLEVYGSCLSGLSLGKNADVDLSLTFSLGVERKLDFEAGTLTAKKYARHVTDTVYQVKRRLENSRRDKNSAVSEFRDITAVPRARVPVIKGVYSGANNPHSEDGSLHFDICLLNDIAVANSGLIKEYSDVDIRVKSLMVAVKRWTRDNKINSAQDNTLSSYTWINLVIFYLQCIGFVPNLQCPSMMRECNHEMGWGKSRRRQDNINNLNTAYLKWKGQADRVWKRSQEVDEAYASVSMLLYGFFRFYSQEFPINLYMISIKRGANIRIPKTMFSERSSLHLCIEDPFETYDSHWPHDLGVPADETGSMLIARCFRDSEEHLRGFLFGNEETISEELWPITTLEKEEDSGRSRRNRKAKAPNLPQNTLVILSSSKNYKKQDLLKIFQQFADETGSRIIGSSLVKGGRLAFVDYDSTAAALAALAAHAKNPLTLDGLPLQVSQKDSAPKHVPNDNSHEVKAANPEAAKAAMNKDDKSEGGKPDTKEEKGNIEKGNPEKGNPETTLVVQSMSGNFSEKGVAKIFRPFAERTKSKLVLVDVTKKKKKAFVEYDSPAAVKAALNEHANNPLMWNGKALDVSQKMTPGWRQREKGEKAQEKSNQTKQKGDGNPPNQKATKKKKGKKKQGKKNKEQDSNKPIIDAKETILGQIYNSGS